MRRFLFGFSACTLHRIRCWQCAKIKKIKPTKVEIVFVRTDFVMMLTKNQFSLNNKQRLVVYMLRVFAFMHTM